MIMLTPLLRRFAEESSPHQAGIKVLFQKYGRYLKGITKADKNMQINIRAMNGAKAIAMLPSLSKVEDVRNYIYQIWGSLPPNQEKRIMMYGQLLRDYEYLIEVGCLPTAVNELYVYFEYTGYVNHTET